MTTSLWSPWTVRHTDFPPLCAAHHSNSLLSPLPAANPPEDALPPRPPGSQPNSLRSGITGSAADRPGEALTSQPSSGTPSPRPRSVYIAICRTNGVVRARTHATIGASLRTNSRASTYFGNWRATIERTYTPIALVARTVSRGQRLIHNLPGSLSRWSFLPRFKFFQEPSRGVFHGFEVSKVLSSAAAHVEQHATKEILNVGKVVGE